MQPNIEEFEGRHSGNSELEITKMVGVEYV